MAHKNMDRFIDRLMNKWIEVKKEKGKDEILIEKCRDRWIFGQMDFWIVGYLNRWIFGQMDLQLVDRQKWIDRQTEMDRNVNRYIRGLTLFSCVF